jgi:hypothetical protein
LRGEIMMKKKTAERDQNIFAVKRTKLLQKLLYLEKKWGQATFFCADSLGKQPEPL